MTCNIYNEADMPSGSQTQRTFSYYVDYTPDPQTGMGVRTTFSANATQADKNEAIAATVTMLAQSIGYTGPTITAADLVRP